MGSEISGSIAAAYYNEVPDNIVDFATSKLTKELKDVADRFVACYK